MPDAEIQDRGFIPPAPSPGERDLPPLRALLTSISRPLEGWPRAIYEQRVWRPPVPGLPVFIMDPDALGAIFGEKAAAFPQGALWRRMMRPVWGDGLVTSEGAAWRWQRRATAPAFRPAHMHALAPVMVRAGEAALERWTRQGRIDLAQECGRITLDVLLDAVLSGGEDFDREELRGLAERFVAQVLKTRLSYFFAPDAFHEGRMSPEAPEGARLRAGVDAMIRRRRAEPPRGDLVDLLLGARDPETGREMGDDILRDNLLGFIVAGHETTATALCWPVWLASIHEPTRRRLRAEVEAVAGDGAIRPEHVERLVFARQVVSESLRLYPVNHLLTRVCVETTEVGGMRVKAGERILAPVYALHRHRLWWREPDRFDPDRFAPDAEPPDRHVYMPFGAGPRICLGAAFAMTELTVLLATFVRGADFTPDPGHRVWPVAENSVVRPEGGLPMTVVRR
ncbi:MAG: cytochrome P450 [Phenylobacterium sp.]|uniref:cytochrome P450 n=1 Tax=Phenylobacterium sp. TaxID=1871053 RepID=UPI001A5C13CB|nr:cytochrome P450 [Phenylobacterium sp.]MBL8773276.1 cytochrome P450 [Phenylobacterium sp.]